MKTEKIIFTTISSIAVSASFLCSPLTAQARQQPVTITYFTWDLYDAKFMQKEAVIFHKSHPDITVKVLPVDSKDYYTKLKLLVAGGDAPDVFLMNGPNFPDFVRSGAIVDLQPYLKQKGYKFNLLPSGVKDLYTYKGDLWTMPGEVDTVGLAYNKDLFKQAGVSYLSPTKPMSWTQFVSDAKKLTKGSNQWGFATTEDDVQTGIYPWIYSGGGQLFKPDWSKASVDSPENNRTLQKISDLILKDKVAPSPKVYGDPSQPLQMFYSGKIAMLVVGTWDCANFAAQNLKFNWDFAPLPYLNKPANVAHGVANAVYSGSKNKEAAIEFALFTGTPQFQADMQKTLGWMSAYGDLSKQFVAMDTIHHRSVFTDALKIAKPYPATPSMSLWENQLIKDMQLVYLGQKSVASTLEDVQGAMSHALSQK